MLPRCICLCVLLCATAVAADQSPIIVDGELADWSSVALLAVDASGDGGSSGVDFGTLWAADDDRFLFLRCEMGAEISLDEGNDLVLYLDTDASSASGLSVGGIGAELEWRLGDRQGTYHGTAGSTSVFHDDVRFRSGPTVSALEFEMALGRDTLPDGQNPLFLGTTVRILLRDEAGGGDRIPDVGETITYTLDVGSLPPENTISFPRDLAGDVRVVTYNVLNDSPWDAGEEPRFGRQLAAVAPDIVNFQEIYDHSAEEAAQLVDAWVSLPPGETWHSASVNDCKTVSRYPVVNTWALSGNLAVLLDATSSNLASEILLINAHLPCCTNDAGRQNEVDEILEFLRDAKSPGGSLTLAPNTPFLVTGDLNLVGLAQQLDSLLTGDIIDESTYGSDFAPDWDGSDLTDNLARQTEKRMGYTWRSDTSSFWPGHLDFIITSDAALTTAKSYIVYTPEMSSGALADNGLLANDSLASDHLLFCADFRSPSPSAPSFVRGDCNGDSFLDVSDPISDLQHLFLGGSVPCADACDGNDDGVADLGDPITLLDAIFGQGPLPAPYPLCGSDPTGDVLDCGAYPACP